MEAISLAESLPQPAFDAIQLLENERKVAEKLNISLYSLMENAGLAVFNHIQNHYVAANRLLIICGKGNNGGDGFVIARLAHLAGMKVEVYLTIAPEELKGDARKAFEQFDHVSENYSLLYPQELTRDFRLRFKGDLIVDCLFGIGFKGCLPKSLQFLVQEINAHKAPVVSVDVPSGLNANLGTVASSEEQTKVSKNTDCQNFNARIVVFADSTVTMIACKKGLLTAQAANYVGKLFLADLSIGKAFSESVNSQTTIYGSDFYQYLPKRLAATHKGNIGLMLAIGGNEGFPGAIRLSSEAALRSGASLVAVCCHEKNQNLVFSGCAELMLAPNKVERLAESSALTKAKVVVIGPGLDNNDWAENLFSFMLKQPITQVIDADGLRLLSKPKHLKSYQQAFLSHKSINKNRMAILTPHPGEAAELIGCSISDIESDRYTAVKSIAENYQAICVLKGAGSLISDGSHVWVNSSGNAGMASGGMGDVLSGIIGALIMQCDGSKHEMMQAVCLAVYIHGRAADIIAEKNGQIGMKASDLFEVVQSLINQKCK